MPVKLSLQIPDEVAAELKQTALQRGVTLTQALKDAIHLDRYARTKKRVIVETDDGDLKEVMLAQ